MARHGDVRYEPSDLGFKEMLNAPQIQAICLVQAARAQAHAESIAPRRTGNYAESFEVVPVTVMYTGAQPGPRVGAELRNTSDHAAAVEWGNSTTKRPHRVLGRVLDWLNGLA